MKFTNIFLIFIVAVLLFSCVKKNKQAGLDEHITGEKTESGLIESGAEKEKTTIKEIIYENDQFFKERDAEIIFLEKANFGIPGGDNWIIMLNSRHIFIYVINDGRIEEDYYGTVGGQHFVDQNLYEISVYNIMRDIPGVHIPGGGVSFGDFNGDGKDELFRYLYVKELGHNIDIFHYEPQKKGFVFCRIRHKLIDQNNGPAPVEFITYNGKYGFKVYYSNVEAAGGQGWTPEPDPKNDKWIFYTWDENQRMFVETGEVN